MTLWLYAVRSAAALDGRGAGGAPLLALDAEELQVVYEPCDRAPEVSRDRALAYGDVVQRLCATHAALPFRFGATVPTEEALRELLRARADEWRRRLEAVRGRCEFIVHLASPAAAAPAARTGTAWLAARAAALRGSESLGESLSTALAPGCREVRRLSAAAGTTRLACLAAPEHAAALRAQVQRWGDAHPLARPRVTGPWPPFSFAEEVAPR